ncbi:hypothetical protein [Paenirhodobacter sp.]|uniref:hypothetical protein n=1 Tax=Paenirhodobacter sp. TaxID=1965326 RepID=UPI003B3E1536
MTAAVAVVALTHVPVPVPDWVLARVEEQVNAALAGRVGVDVTGGADLIIDEGLMPRVLLRGVQVRRPSGAPMAVLPQLRVSFWPEPLMRGRMVPESLRIDGATIALRRLPDGRIDLDLGGAGAMEGFDLRSLGQISAAVEEAFDTPALRALARVTAQDVRIRIDDSRLNRVWDVSDGAFRLTQTGSEIALALAFDVGDREGKAARVSLDASTSKLGPEASFGATVTDVPAQDLAVQSPAVAMLGLLDAAISGTFRTGIGADGALMRTDATLSVGKGAISPVEGAAPVPFEGAEMALSYDPQAQKVTVSDASFTSKALRFRASGQSYLRDFQHGLPREALVQVQMRDIEADPEGIFESPARFSFGAADARLRLDPFRVDLGQLQLVKDAQRISGKGRIAADADGWRVVLDAGIDRIDQHDLLALWPPRLVPPTRHWLAENVMTGELQNARAAVRIAPGQEPRFELGYEFRGAEVRILRTLPAVREGRGFATIHDDSHTLMVEEGTAEAPSGGRVEVADSVMSVPDIREKPARAEVALVTRAPIPAALSLLDEEPFRFLSKAGRGTDLAQGWAEARTNLRFRMEKKVDPKDVDFDVTARLTDVSTDKIVPGKSITAPLLVLRADRAGMTISGKGQFESVPFDARWSQRFGEENKGRSALDGYVNVTPAALAGVGISLPKGMVAGSGWGRLSLGIVQGQPVRYDFLTDLKGISLSVPGIQWSKPAAPKGKLALAGVLSQPPTVEKLELEAPGLSLAGHLDLSARGMERAVFDRLAIGSWFNGAVDLIGKGKDRAPDVAIRKGVLDLRHMKQGKSSPGAGNRIDVGLDRLIVSDGLALTALRGSFTTRNGLAGDFAARVNGSAQIEGAVGPAAGGRTAVQIRSPDAGAVLASARITDRAASGDMVLNLSPVGQHSYEGKVHVAGLRVTDAPVLASMLSAASIIGLVEQLNGEGIVFSDVDVAFRLTPEGISITTGEATGASMGVTMAGNYFPKTGQIDMEGVVSPLYILNSVGQIFSRKGEGLFGFTYTIQGAAKAPSVTVNPLSILTPGALRDLFRRTPPLVRMK